MCPHRWLSGCLWLVFALCCQAQPADQPAAVDDKLHWGHFSATFRYDGEPPEPRKLEVDKDREAIKLPLFDRSLQVDPKTKGLANVVVWLYRKPSEKLPPIHASYAELAKQEVVLENRNSQLEPHVAILWTEQTLLLRNRDPIGHNHVGAFFVNPAWSDLSPAGGGVKKRMSKAESRPMPLACNIHPWESGWLLIRDNPYMAVSDSQGKLQIKNLPAGEHTFVLWHEVPGFLKELNRDGKVLKLKNGRLTMNIKPGESDLGELLLNLQRN
jgi:hypothetical protein